MSANEENAYCNMRQRCSSNRGVAFIGSVSFRSLHNLSAAAEARGLVTEETNQVVKIKRGVRGQ